jgi:hypothetical protein
MAKFDTSVEPYSERRPRYTNALHWNAFLLAKYEPLSWAEVGIIIDNCQFVANDYFRFASDDQNILIRLMANFQGYAVVPQRDPMFPYCLRVQPNKSSLYAFVMARHFTEKKRDLLEVVCRYIAQRLFKDSGITAVPRTEWCHVQKAAEPFVIPVDRPKTKAQLRPKIELADVKSYEALPLAYIAAVFDHNSFITKHHAPRSFIIRLYGSNLDLLCRILRTIGLGYIVYRASDAVSPYYYVVNKGEDVIKVLAIIGPFLQYKQNMATHVSSHLTNHCVDKRYKHRSPAEMQARSESWLAFGTLLECNSNRETTVALARRLKEAYNALEA